MAESRGNIKLLVQDTTNRMRNAVSTKHPYTSEKLKRNILFCLATLIYGTSRKSLSSIVSQMSYTYGDKRSNKCVSS